MSVESANTALQADCGLMGVSVSPTQAAQLLSYLDLLQKWNRVYNLTAIEDPEQMRVLHLLDSLSIAPYLRGRRLLDVGAGAGLPGIPLAIVRPDISVTLVDSNAKKTRFMQQVKAQLQLDNLQVIHGRIEQIPTQSVDMVTARAFARVEQIIDLAGKHCDDSGYLLLMKGARPDDECQALPAGYQVTRVVELKVPGCAARRHVVEIHKAC